MQHTDMAGNVEVVEVKKGVRLVRIKTDGPTSVISVWFDVGSRNDPKGKEGLVHFAEHLFMKTTASHRTLADVRMFHVTNGIYANAHTGPGSLRFRYETLAENAMDNLRHFVKFFCDSFVTQEAFEAEKSIIMDERARSAQSPAAVSHDLLFEALFPQGGLGHSGLGTESSVQAIVREDVEAFVSSVLRQGPKTFVVVGPHETSAIVSVLADLPDVQVNAGVIHEVTAGSPVKLVVKKKEGSSIRVDVGYRGCAAGEMADRAALTCLGLGYLCNGMASRLVMRLRNERGYTYGVGGHRAYYQEVGFFSFSFSVPKQHLRESLSLALAEVAKLREGKIDSVLLEAAKKEARFRFLANSTDPIWVMDWHGGQIAGGGRQWSVAEFDVAMTALTPADLMRVANAYLTPERMSVVLAGDVDLSEELL